MYSTGKSALKALLHHPLPRIILQYRSLSARVYEMYERIRDAQTAAAALASGKAAASADAAAAASDLVRLRATWLQTHTCSGRLSVDGVPLQNVSNGIAYKLHGAVAALQPGEQTHDFSDDELGSDDDADDAGAAEEEAREITATAAGSAAAAAALGGVAQGGPEPSAADKHKPTAQPQQQQQQDQDQQVDLRFASVRFAFVASPGCVILGADYCQIEFRLMAHFSGDASLVQAFSCGDDPFKALAGNWLKKPADQVRTAAGDSPCRLGRTTVWSSYYDRVYEVPAAGVGFGWPGLVKGGFIPNHRSI